MLLKAFYTPRPLLPALRATSLKSEGGKVMGWDARKPGRFGRRGRQEEAREAGWGRVKVSIAYEIGY